MKRIKKFSIILSFVIVVPGIFFALLYLASNKSIFLQCLYSILSLAMLVYLSIIIYSLLYKRSERSPNKLIILAGYILLSLFLLLHTGVLAIFLEMISPFVVRLFFIIMTFTFSFSLTNSINKEHHELIILKNNLEQKVKERTRQLEEAKAQQETFFINIAHEIKTPLTIVTNSFSRFYPSCDNPGDLHSIRIGLEKMKRDIVNFLDLHKLKSGKFFYDHEHIINCSSMVKEAMVLFRKPAEKKGICLLVSIDTDRLYVKIDPFAFNRIVNNLLENSLKYNNPGGKISITLAKSDDKIILSVSDTGIGIPEEVIGNIFRPYYQISHKKRNIQGLGMGLAIIKEICDDIHAGIFVESKEKKGTCVTISFIRYDICDTDIISTETENHFYITDSPGGGQCKDPDYCPERPSILLVEDNEDLLGFLRNKLKDDYNVYCVRNGKEGLKKICQIKNPDIIISDIMMDEMDGQTFRTKIIQDNTYSSIPFIFLTAISSQQTKLQCLADGAVDYIIKPFSVDELLYKIEALIKMRRALNKKNLAEVEKLVDLHVKNIAKKQIDESYNTGKSHIYTQHGISDQEIRVISMLKQGLLYKEIAANLHISINSVRTYIRRIHKKLNIQSTAQLFEVTYL